MFNKDYHIRKSYRAKRVILKVTAEGLEVVVPAGFDVNMLPPILEKRKAWIDKSISKLQAIERPGLNDKFPPETVELPAINLNIVCRYHNKSENYYTLRNHSENAVLISGPLQNSSPIKILLKKWLKDQAGVHLPPWLTEISRETGLRFTKVQIRNQKTRWGSCSSRKSISLNCNLLFMSPEVVRYVMVHELCHTIHHDHSARFWKLVEKFDSDFEKHKALLKKADILIPGWAQRRR